MEKVMSEFGYQAIEQKVKAKLHQIKQNHSHLTDEGETLQVVQQIIQDTQTKIVALYKEQEQQIFKQMNLRLYQIDEK